jgi:hypothetical protein
LSLPRPSSAWALACALVLAIACSSEEPAPPSLSARVFLDRTELRVGDPLGLTIEIDAPPGYAVEAPTPPPPDPHFVTESLERLEPVLKPDGLRHRILWTLRARDLGEPTTPRLDVPLVRPDGVVQPLAVGGFPIPVRSVIEEVEQRDVYFDIQPAPEPVRPRALAWGAAGVALAAALGVGLLVVRRRRVRPPAAPTPAELRSDAARRLEEALLEADPRALAAQLAATLWDFVARLSGETVGARTAGELPAGVDPRLAAVLAGLERVRFRRAPERAEALQLAAEARTLFRDADRR